MSLISGLQESFCNAVDNCTKYIPILIVAIPIGVEIIRAVAVTLQSPKTLKKNAKKIKASINDAVCLSEGESPADYQRKILKKVAIGWGLTFFGGAVLALNIYFLTPKLGIATSALTLLLIKALYSEGSKIPTKIKNQINHIRSICSLGNNENRVQLFPIATTWLVSLIFTGFSLYQLGLVFNSHDRWKIIPANQSSSLVFTEYAVVGAMHAMLSMHAYINNDKTTLGNLATAGSMSLHLLAALSSLAFPIGYLIDSAKNDWGRIRIHHSFLGLLVQLIPSRTLKILGLAITLDSATYGPCPDRDEDLMNVLLRYLIVLINSLTSMVVVEEILQNLFTPKKAKPKISYEFEIA